MPHPNKHSRIVGVFCDVFDSFERCDGGLKLAEVCITDTLESVDVLD